MVYQRTGTHNAEVNSRWHIQPTRGIWLETNQIIPMNHFLVVMTKDIWIICLLCGGHCKSAWHELLVYHNGIFWGDEEGRCMESRHLTFCVFPKYKQAATHIQHGQIKKENNKSDKTGESPSDLQSSWSTVCIGTWQMLVVMISWSNCICLFKSLYQIITCIMVLRIHALIQNIPCDSNVCSGFWSV